jgi:Tol biopolymer transport system component
MNKSSFVVLVSFALVITIAIIAIFFARGYQIDFTKKTVSGTGILVATSDPDGAEVLINGKLKTATNNTINLEPGKYTIRLEKDGFSPWEKSVEVKREEVFKTNAFLFPRVPDLRPLTFTGATNPTVSPDGTKIVYSVASASAEKNGIWIADISRSAILSPLGSPADLRQITKQSVLLPVKETKFLWSPDSKEIIAFIERPVTIPAKQAPLKIATSSAESTPTRCLKNSRRLKQRLT